MACSSIIILLAHSRKLPTKVELDAATPLTQKKGTKQIWTIIEASASSTH